MQNDKPTLYTSLSPALLNLYEVSSSIVVIIDVLRATSTIATALHNGAKAIIPVDSVAECIRIGKQIDSITAGERDGQVAEGLTYGNSPFEYPADFIGNKTLVLTTTNGTKLLHMALASNAKSIITGSFPNLSAVCDYLVEQKQNVILGCAAWKDRVNIEDTLFAGAVIEAAGYTGLAVACVGILLIGWGFAQPGVRRIVANCRFDNAASIRVLQKAGLRQTGRDREDLTWEVLASEIRDLEI